MENLAHLIPFMHRVADVVADLPDADAIILLMAMAATLTAAKAVKSGKVYEGRELLLNATAENFDNMARRMSASAN